MIKKENEGLGSEYFSDTPKNSWELFTWMFTEPIKLKKFSASTSRMRSVLWYIKVSVWVALFVLLISIGCKIFLTPRHPNKNMLNLQKSKEKNGTYRRTKKGI